MSTVEETVRRKYQHNNITNLIFRVDFPKILDLDLKAPTAEFQKIVLPRFPILKEVDLGHLKLNLQKDMDPQTEHETEHAWNFLNKEENKKIFVSSNCITIEYFNNSYKDYEELSDDIKMVFDAAINLYPLKIAERIGLRYINQIEIKDEDNVFDWSDLINSNLYALTHDFTSTDDDDVLRSMHLLEITENGHNLKFQFGLFNSDYPSPIARKEFVLDYDVSTKQNSDISDIFKIVNELHQIADKWFEKSIEDGLRDRMGVLDGE